MMDGITFALAYNKLPALVVVAIAIWIGWLALRGWWHGRQRDAKLRLVIERIRREQPEISANALAHRLNKMGVEREVSSMGIKGLRWDAQSVQRLLKRLGAP